MPINLDHKPGLVIYLTVGDPSVAATHAIALAAIDAGADVLELGVPFSDPLADGPVIQRASERAVASGTRLVDVLALAADLRRERPHAGLVIFSYLNPILRFGLARFCAEASSAGVDGVLVIDITVEEARGEYLDTMRRAGLKPIFLVAPTSPDARLEGIAEVSEGFIYAISRTGITGAQATLAADAMTLVERLRHYTTLPIAVGFGVSHAAHVSAIAQYADAAVIGSAIVALIEQSTPQEAPAVIARFIQGLRPAPALAHSTL